jgi:hypothetical protein
VKLSNLHSAPLCRVRLGPTREGGEFIYCFFGFDRYASRAAGQLQGLRTYVRKAISPEIGTSMGHPVTMPNRSYRMDCPHPGSAAFWLYTLIPKSTIQKLACRLRSEASPPTGWQAGFSVRGRCVRHAVQENPTLRHAWGKHGFD